MGKPKKITFENDGEEWSGSIKADRWLGEHGYSRGSMQGDSRIGIKKGEGYISKWRGLSEEDIKELDGYIESSDHRNGTVTIILF